MKFEEVETMVHSLIAVDYTMSFSPDGKGGFYWVNDFLEITLSEQYEDYYLEYKNVEIHEFVFAKFKVPLDKKKLKQIMDLLEV